ncbi:AMP-binding protein [Novosphingobium resinovorum]
MTSLAWNTHRHFELFFAVPGMGAVLHTANPRLPDEHLVYTINHAGSRVLLLDRNMAATVARIRDRLEHVERLIVLSDRTCEGIESYEDLIAPHPDALDWPGFDENAAAFLCYTSGTTGDPKGVLYSHRSTVLHALAADCRAAWGSAPSTW